MSMMILKASEPLSSLRYSNESVGPPMKAGVSALCEGGDGSRDSQGHHWLSSLRLCSYIRHCAKSN